MPRKGRSRRRSRARRNGSSSIQGNGLNANAIVRVPFSTIDGYSLSSTPIAICVNDVQATPFADHLEAVASGFNLCRLVSLEITFFPSAYGSAAYTTAIGYQPFTPYTTPASLKHVMELSSASTWLYGSTVPARLTLSRKVLLGEGPMKWYPTRRSSTTNAILQGLVWYCSVGSQSVNMRVSGVYEFCSPCAQFEEVKETRSDSSEWLRLSPLGMPDVAQGDQDETEVKSRDPLPDPIPFQPPVHLRSGLKR
jgi:hypothetical protein